MSKTVRVAENSGFCFGVASAARAVENQVKIKLDGERIFTLGKLIHNNIYNERLKSQGVGVTSESELRELARSATERSPVKVFVRAHGIPAQTEELLRELSVENKSFSYVDCTCPFVKKIHKIVSENSSADGQLLVFGNPEHPEVLGFCSKFEGKKFIFSKASQLEAAINDGRVKIDCAKQPIVVAQTTQNLGEFEKTKKLLKKVYAKPLIYDTICSVTEKRQTEAKSLARESDFMIVIGSRDSSNSVKLYDICRAECENTIMVETAAELAPYKYLNHKKIGIAAGASTPSDVIQEVQNTMSEAIENFAELLENSLKTLNT